MFFTACNRTKLLKEGPEDEIFLYYGPKDVDSEAVEVGDDQGSSMDKEREERTFLVDQNLDVPRDSFRFSSLGQDDMNVLKISGIEVDDDNTSAPDNVPFPSDKEGSSEEVLQWGQS